MNKLVTTLIFIIFSLISFSQENKLPKQIIYNGDTCVVFSISQAKQLVLWDLDRLECFDIKDNYLLSNVKLTELLELKNSQILAYEIKDSVFIVTLNAFQELQTLNDYQKKIFEKNIKIQKRQNFKNVILGILSTFVITWILK
jgi:hypothetical protein|tara:strand:+ start:369 stop:797 length:429 start_codon:yes stop_codon:yes gene_type:complete